MTFPLLEKWNIHWPRRRTIMSYYSACCDTYLASDACSSIRNQRKHSREPERGWSWGNVGLRERQWPLCCEKACEASSEKHYSEEKPESREEKHPSSRREAEKRKWEKEAKCPTQWLCVLLPNGWRNIFSFRMTILYILSSKKISKKMIWSSVYMTRTLKCPEICERETEKLRRSIE